MKSIIELTKAIGETSSYLQQFNEWKEKRILFINPQLSGKHLYKMLLPCFALNSSNTCTAIQHISKYDPKWQLLGGKEVDISDDIIEWATHIVFPFTTQPLVAEIYSKIRNKNPICKIIYNVDLNFYELSPKHPYYEIFKEESVLSAVEDNMFFADITMVSNYYFRVYLQQKFPEIIKERYANEYTNMGISVIPFFIDSEMVMENIEYVPSDLTQVKKESIHTPEVKEKIEAIAQQAAEVKGKTVKLRPIKQPKKSVQKPKTNAAKGTSSKKPRKRKK